MFICTANVLHTIPQPLQDRMEVLRIPGYTEQEKHQIAQRFLVPKQLEATGLTGENLKFTDEGRHAHHPALHARSGRAQPRPRNRQRLPQGGAQGGGRRQGRSPPS